MKPGIPYHLPQISASYSIVLQKLNDEGINYKFVEVDPNELNPSQPFTFSDHVEKVEIDDNNPIWISNDQSILDGHHRYVKSLNDNKPLKAIKIDLDNKTAIRILNKIQDIYEYEQNQNMEEIVSNDVINLNNEIDTDNDDFFNSLEEDNNSIELENSNKNPQTIIAYRKEPIKENSIVGNFFLLNPVDGYDKYEIEFENLLDTDSLGIAYKESQEPVTILAKIWFPNINFEKISEEQNIPSINLKNKAVAKLAKVKGFDGIKYGNKLIQGLK